VNERTNGKGRGRKTRKDHVQEKTRKYQVKKKSERNGGCSESRQVEEFDIWRTSNTASER